ncbi:MAG: radical SAM protein [bacterium]
MLLVNEVYRSILGESQAAGWPAVIIRLTGCHCRCTYCDTVHAFTEGEEQSVGQLSRQVDEFGCRRVLVTGGEPLLQPEVVHLLTDLLRNEKLVWLETSGVTGTVPLSQVPAGVRRVVDVKTPSSGIDSSLIDWEGDFVPDGGG